MTLMSEDKSHYVYVLTNPAMPGMVKIGMTSADDPKELSLIHI